MPTALLDHLATRLRVPPCPTFRASRSGVSLSEAGQEPGGEDHEQPAEDAAGDGGRDSLGQRGAE
jgi:hypothetical protein